MAAKWKDVPGFEGIYQASTDGRIRNARGQEIGHRGVLVKLIDSDGKRTITTVPRVILTTFRGPPPSDKHMAVRLDRTKNNALKNLAWKTRTEFPPKSILDLKKAKEVKKLAKRGLKTAEIAERFGVSSATIRGIVTGQNWADA